TNPPDGDGCASRDRRSTGIFTTVLLAGAATDSDNWHLGGLEVAEASAASLDHAHCFSMPDLFGPAHADRCGVGAARGVSTLQGRNGGAAAHCATPGHPRAAESAGTFAACGGGTSGFSARATRTVAPTAAAVPSASARQPSATSRRGDRYSGRPGRAL